jgi:aryl-alcohol dehydrogenase-like predicted oxidoreductase
MAEIALRWVSHHSLLRAAAGDAVIIGGSNLKHVEEVRNLFVYVFPMGSAYRISRRVAEPC